MESSPEALLHRWDVHMGEKFYLRLLLAKFWGVTSFEHLRKVRGEALPTFKTACLHLDLLEDDSE
jgi:hypothetical protein